MPSARQEREPRQTTDVIMMIVPAMFGFNEQTAIDQTTGQADNVFQKRENLGRREIQGRAIREFINMVDLLEDEGIKVVVVDNRKRPDGKYIVTPDAVFPNNWISFHESQIVLYPMKAKNRREERQIAEVLATLESSGIVLEQPVVDLTKLEDEGTFVEGTGSLVLDRPNRLAFACLSQRTSEQAVNSFGEVADFEPIIFHAKDAQGNEVYHTNVVMSIGEKFAVVCFDAIQDEAELFEVEKKLADTDKEIIAISLEQMNQMCGNILQVDSAEGKKIVMSRTAHNGFSAEQIEILENHGKLVVVDIDQIEKTGGGSARCMMAEVFI